MRFKKVMVAIDGSEGSNKALEYGAELVKNNDGELTLVHVMERKTSPAVYGDASGYANAEVIEREMEEDKQSKKRKGEALLKNAKTRVETLNMNMKTELLEGEAVHAICEYAEKKQSDLIVIGSRGLSGLKKLVMGSVSEKVTQNASCPVLIVK